MKKYLKLAVLAVMLLFLTAGLTGCVLVNVNPERDNAEVIAKIDGKDLTKSVYNNNIALAQMNYEAGDQQWPTGGNLKTLKENLYDSIIQQEVFALKAEKDKKTVDEEKLKQDVEERVNTLQEEVGEDLYKKYITDNYSTLDDFKAWLQTSMKQEELATKVTDKFEEDFKKDPSKILDQSVGKINGEDVSRGEYEYFLSNEAVNYYMSNQSSLPTDKESMEETNKTIFENIEKINANIKYCEDNKIEIKEEDINTELETVEQTTSSMFQDDSEKEDFLQSYFLTSTSYADYQRLQAKGQAAENAIEDYCKEKAEVSDKEAEDYYNENSEDYDTTEVSAMHILSKDKTAAEQVYDEAKDITTKEDFQKLVDKYKDVEGIEEATDLGSFDYKTMVKEFSDAAFNAQLNTVLAPVETEFGYHVIYVYDKTNGGVKKFDEVKQEIIDQLKDDKGQEEFDKLEEDLTDNASYDIPDEIFTPLEEYANDLEKEYKVEKFESRIRA